MVVCQKMLQLEIYGGVILTKFQVFDHVLIVLNPPRVCVFCGGDMYLLPRSNSNTANVYVVFSNVWDC